MATLRRILLALSFLLISSKIFSCEVEPALEVIAIDIKRSSMGASGYEVLVKKRIGQHKLADLTLHSERDERVIFSISTPFHDASNYDDSEIYKTHMKSSVILSDSEIDSVDIVATYSQSAEGSALLMCAPTERVSLRELVNRYNKSKQQGPSAGTR